jgi:hypothetical protein
MWPLLVRELRVQARSRLHFSMRLLGAATLLGGLVWCGWRLHSSALLTGSGLFGLLARMSVGLIWCIGPFLTADCIAQEKREGTLGLLWMTPLRPWQVVLAKSLARSVDGFTLLAAALPVFAIPLLMGGVGWPDVLRLALLQTSALTLSLSAGLMASSVARGWWTTRVVGGCINVVLLGVFLVVYQTIWVFPQWWTSQGSGRPLSFVGLFEQRLFLWIWQARQVLAGLDSGWMPSFPPASWRLVLQSAGVAFLMVLLAMTVCAASAWGLISALRRQAFGEGDMSNPRQNRRSRAESMLKAGVVSVGTLYLIATLVDWPTVDHLRETGRWAVWILSVSAALWGATRFRREWETGLWELLAVVPGGSPAWIARTMAAGGWIWVGAGGGFVLVSHLVGVLAVESAPSGRYPWWLGGWLLVQGGTALVLPWAALWSAACVARGGGRAEFAASLALGTLAIGTLLIEPFVLDLLLALNVPWSGRWGEPYWMQRGGGVVMANAALAGLIKVLWWSAVGALARHRALTSARDHPNSSRLRASPKGHRPDDPPDAEDCPPDP